MSIVVGRKIVTDHHVVLVIHVAKLVLQSMCKYVTEVLIQQAGGDSPGEQLVFPLPLTTFIAVTAYQNKNIVEMKIQNNPFAKAFRYVSSNLLNLHPVEDNYLPVFPLVYNVLPSQPHDLPYSLSLMYTAIKEGVETPYSKGYLRTIAFGT